MYKLNVKPKSDKSLLWLHVELAFNLTPWTWQFGVWKGKYGRDLTLCLGPIGLVVIDG